MEYLYQVFGGQDQTAQALDTFFQLLSTYALYFVLFVAIAMAVYAFCIFRRDESYLAGARKVMLGVAVGCGASVIATLGVVKLLYYVADGKVNGKFWLVVAMLGFLVIAVVTCAILSKKSAQAHKWAKIVFAIIFLVGCVLLVCLVPAKSDSYVPLSSASMYVFTVAIVAVTVALALACDTPSGSQSKAISYASVCIALSFALSYVKFFSLPQGGSVTFASLLPLVLYSFMFGSKRGLVAGVIYGLLQFVQSPQFYQPMQVLVDYPIAFGAIGIAGFARKLPFCKRSLQAQFAVGATVACALRYLAHCVSGYFVFSGWAMEGYTALGWAVVYNLYVVADLAVLVAVGVVALSYKNLKQTVLSVQNGL